MIIPSGIHKRPLVSTSRIFSTSITESSSTISIFIDFSSDVSVVQNWSFHWKVRNLVSMMNHSPLLWENLIWKSGVVIITRSRLSKVDHRNIETSLNKAHSAQLGKSCSKTMSCYFYLVGWVHGLKPSHFCQNIVPNSINAPIKSGVNSAIALRPGIVWCWVRIDVHVLLLIRLSTLKNDKDGLIRRQVSGVPFNIPKLVVDNFRSYKTSCSFCVILLHV